MDLKKGEKIYKGKTELKVVSVHKSGLTAILEAKSGMQRLMRMSTIDAQWSKTKPAAKQ